MCMGSRALRIGVFAVRIESGERFANRIESRISRYNYLTNLGLDDKEVAAISAPTASQL